MSRLFTKSAEMMLRRTGTVWTATVDSEPIEFYAVFDAENRLENDATGQAVLINGTVVTILSSLAKKLTFGQQLTDDQGNVWELREKMAIDDGFLTRAFVALKEEGDDC